MNLQAGYIRGDSSWVHLTPMDDLNQGYGLQQLNKGLVRTFG